MMSACIECTPKYVVVGVIRHIDVNNNCSYSSQGQSIALSIFLLMNGCKFKGNLAHKFMPLC